jgi:hypothetical protein
MISPMPRQLLQPKRIFLLGLVFALLPACSTTPRTPTTDQENGASRSGDHPLGTGSVEFVGFSAEELREFRVIPEDGGELFAPRGGIRINDVDGFLKRDISVGLGCYLRSEQMDPIRAAD